TMIDASFSFRKQDIRVQLQSSKITSPSHISNRRTRSLLPLTYPREEQGHFSLPHLQEKNKVTSPSHISKTRTTSLLPPTSPERIKITSPSHISKRRTRSLLPPTSLREEQ
ncbi:hypothetical protein ACJMK2_017572, partial [Sinanodonta woodiana]